jgi:hypothetical protein
MLLRFLRLGLLVVLLCLMVMPLEMHGYVNLFPVWRILIRVF